MLILAGDHVRSLLSFAECADVMRSALAGLATGEIQQPLRTVIRPSGAAGFMALMPAYAPDAGYGLKALTINPGNPAKGLDTHQGGVLLFDAVTGEPAALVNASALTEIRTAAVSAVASGLLALPGADLVAIIGTGVQAFAHARALAATRVLSGIRMTSRCPGKVRDRAAALEAELGVPVQLLDSVPDALEHAGIVVTATSSPVPVLRRAWLAPGAHINAVGACVPGERELDTATMADAALFADSRESLRNEAGDYLLAVADGAAVGQVRATLGELLTGAVSGRAGSTEITVFESLGLAAEDLAAASFVYEKARMLGIGTAADF